MKKDQNKSGQSPRPDAPPHESPRILPYRSLGEYMAGSVTWFFEPYFPRGILTLLVGETCVGKSSMLAWLISQAKSTVFFPGFEESFRIQTLPRLLLYPLDKDSIHVVDAGEWYLPDCKTRLRNLVAGLSADLVVMDPVSSYMREGGSKNDEAFVRSALEVLSEIAAGTGAAVVGVRHPGKAAGNVMMGSGEWRNVPKSIVHLLHDPGPPVRRLIRLYKDCFGRGESSRAYHLQGEPGQPPRFVLGEPIGAAEAAQLARLEDDLERSRFTHAQHLITEALAEEEQLSTVMYSLAMAERISERTLFRAAQALGVVMRREGSGSNHKCLWALPGKEGGVSESHGGSEDKAQPTNHKAPVQQELGQEATPAMTQRDTSTSQAAAPRPKPARRPAKRKPMRVSKPTKEPSNNGQAEEVEHG